MTATVTGSTLPAADSTLTLVYEHRIIPDCAGETITTAAQADIDYIKGDPVKSTLLPLYTAPYGCPIRYTLCFMDKKLAAPAEQCTLSDTSSTNILHLMNNVNPNSKPGNETAPLRTLHIYYDVDNTFGIDPLFAHTLDMTLKGSLWGQTTSVATSFKVNLIAQCAGVLLSATVNSETAPFKFFHKVAKTEAA